LWQRGAIEKKDFELLNEAMKKQEEQTKAKVLEALEREFLNYENNSPNKGHIEYYETEVKPKYEKKNS
jgi:hypothetical protein